MMLRLKRKLVQTTATTENSVSILVWYDEPFRLGYENCQGFAPENE
jgi:hypothetical protein